MTRGACSRSRQGTALFYVTPAGAVTTVAISPGAPLNISTAVMRVSGGHFTSPGNLGRTYDVSADGERLLMTKENQQSLPYRFVIVQHWDQDLRRLLAAK